MSCAIATGHFRLAADQLSFAGATDRFGKNLAALQLVHQLEAEGRLASDEERLVLAHYSAFGESALLNRLFRFDHAAGRYLLHDSYAAFLSSDDARHLRVAALTAFYTPLDIVAAIWQAVEQLGLGALERPRIIEPAAGVGHFISAMPPELRTRAEITAVELDPVTARILGHIHPDISLHGGVGFERVDLPPNGFDLAISNVPFGDMAVHDPTIPAALRHQLHDFFFAKALRLVRSGGLVVFLTSCTVSCPRHPRGSDIGAEQAARVSSVFSTPPLVCPVVTAAGLVSAGFCGTPPLRPPHRGLAKAISEVELAWQAQP